MPKIQAVIFDWGGILIENPAEAILAFCSRALNVAPSILSSVVQKYEPLFQTNAITEDQFWGRVCTDLNVPKFSHRSLWDDALRYAYRPRLEVFDLIGKLRIAGYRTALLSNTEMPAVEIYREKHDGTFDVVVLSCLEGIRKPDRQIYHRTVARLRVAPEEALLLDDRIENVEGAKQAGLNACLCVSIKEIMNAVSTLPRIVSP
ncbi:MAG TPA: HAD family phosphatase [Bacteroidota bacterium]|nr:HAD family phosphatase [Bacteroidota bacterium]